MCTSTRAMSIVITSPTAMTTSSGSMTTLSTRPSPRANQNGPTDDCVSPSVGGVTSSMIRALNSGTNASLRRSTSAGFCAKRACIARASMPGAMVALPAGPPRAEPASPPLESASRRSSARAISESRKNPALVSASSSACIRRANSSSLSAGAAAAAA
eukprot:Amastigsp_a180661_7.p2 type:complete len:158 gc:universal Amastigsp_a180661_7:873-400(-)